MTHELYQNYPTLAAYSPFLNPALAGLFGSPYAGLQSPISNNPWHNPGLQNPFIALAMQNPWIAAVQQHNPMVNPVLAQLAGLQPYGMQQPFQQQAALQHNPMANPVLAQLAGLQPYAMQQPFQQQPFQQQPQLGFGGGALGPQTSPYSQFNAPLAPQSWVGQGFAGQSGQTGGGYGQINPLFAQLATRAFQGVNPWAGI